jgi:two-component system sensor histidine kinase KdpD
MVSSSLSAGPRAASPGVAAFRMSRSAKRVAAYAGAAAAVLVTVGLAFLLHRLMPHANLSLLFLTGVLMVAARSGLGPSLLASVLSFLAFNYFFTKPYFTLQVADDGDVATLAFFLVIAAITGNLAARMYREVSMRQHSLQRMSELYDFSRQMSSAAGTAAVPEALAQHLNKSLGRAVWVLLSDAGKTPTVKFEAGQPSDLAPDEIETAWLSKATQPFSIAPWTFFLLATSREQMGLIAIQGELDSEQMDSVQSLCEQAGVALERTRLVEDLEETRVVYETEQLRSALLSSVSHDLRTPLASIIGSTTSLLEYGDSISPDDRRELLETVVEESQRLDRHIQNLLDMTRIGQGGLKLRRDWVDLHDTVSSALNRLRSDFRGLEVEIDVAPAVPLLWIHGVLIEQALVNLLDNAIRYSPDNGRITVSARAQGAVVEIDVCDEGPGIPESERELIFDMFYSAQHGDRGKHQGTGLGLTICRGMVGAHHGEVVALEGPNGRGTCMRITLPIYDKE